MAPIGARDSTEGQRAARRVCEDLRDLADWLRAARSSPGRGRGRLRELFRRPSGPQTGQSAWAASTAVLLGLVLDVQTRRGGGSDERRHEDGRSRRGSASCGRARSRLRAVQARHHRVSRLMPLGPKRSRPPSSGRGRCRRARDPTGCRGRARARARPRRSLERAAGTGAGRTSPRSSRRRRRSAPAAVSPSPDEAVGVAVAVPALVVVAHDRSYRRPSSASGASIRSPITGCASITFRSSAVSGPGFIRMLSGMPILPTSWRTAPSSSASSSGVGQSDCRWPISSASAGQTLRVALHARRRGPRSHSRARLPRSARASARAAPSRPAGSRLIAVCDLLAQLGRLERLA